MKVKDVERTANVAWSPANQHPILLATGTAAQQLDASFSTNSALELYALNLSEPGFDMQLRGSIPTEHRFHKLVWSPHGPETGTIVGGCDNGLIEIYSSNKLAKNEPALTAKTNKHVGPVHALDFNTFQHNLLATGASESEIFIWDLNNTNTPMSPGAKSQPLDDVLSVAWNLQVQHILASTFATKCVVWDLRKNEPIIKLTDTVSRIRWKVVAWHPLVATQLCLASEEDQAPIIQVWDLRFATSPLKTLENHQRGILSMSWCRQDPDLLISCAKDNRIICWNPNSNQPGGEILSEVARTNQWNFDVAWCPRNPAVIACPNFDGHISVYSLMGGKTQQFQTTNKIADSFPNMDGYIMAPVQQQQTGPVSVDLSKPPKWMKRPSGASFGFGGKLISFGLEKPVGSLQTEEPIVPRVVYVSQVVTEQELVRKSVELEQALEYGNFTEYCTNKANMTNDQHKKYIWYFLKANFEANPTAELLNLLGYCVGDVNEKLNQHVGRDAKNSMNELNNQFANLNRTDDENEFIANKISKSPKPFRINTGDDIEGLITQALLLGNLEAAVELCFKARRFADAIIIALTGTPELLAKAQHKYLQQSEGYLSSLISSLVSEDWSTVINNCDISNWKEALAATLSHCSEDERTSLTEQLGSRLEGESRSNQKLLQDAQLCYIVSGNFDKLVSSWSGKAKKTSKDLQELVELVSFLQKAIERQGRQVEVSGHLADLLSYYASLLASQGHLNTALNYLGTSQNPQIVQLRERLSINLGQKSAYNSAPQQPYAQGQRSRTNSSRQSFSTYLNQPLTAGFPQFNNATWQQPSERRFSQPPKVFSPEPVAPPSQPPRPTSVGSNQGNAGLPSRNKYVVDPSVRSNQYGTVTNPYNPNAMLPPLPQPFQPNAFQGQLQGQSLLSPNPSSPQNNFYNPTPIQSQPMSFQNNAIPEVAQQAEVLQQPPPPVATYANSPPGWNDPPAFNRAKVQPKQDFSAKDPITHPLYGTAPVPAFPTDNGYADPNRRPSFAPAPTPYAPQEPQPQPGRFNTQPFNHPAQQQQPFVPPQEVNRQQPPAPVEKPQPVEKPPIPDEHSQIQVAFDELRSKCTCAANNAQLKRKLEDVARKLEALYDLLREHKLSPNTLGGLHQMVQLVRGGNYQEGLALHTQMVSGPDFAQIASFMPGLKVLLQCCLQLQVYL